MSSARFLVGDVRARQAELIAADERFELVICSPPFLALRSYLPDGHPDKALEIGSEATPADYLDVLLALTAEWGRLLAPHGSIAIELGDTYAGSGGAGGDYNPDGLREGQPRFRMPPNSPETAYPTPLEKSLMGIPALYQVALAYGINPLTGQASPAGRWRVRNLKAWIRSNPPVGALGDKERPATSYIIVACRARDRWFDLDAVRTPFAPTWVGEDMQRKGQGGGPKSVEREASGIDGQGRSSVRKMTHEGAPPRDWWHNVDAILDAELALRAGKKIGRTPGGPRHRNDADGHDRIRHPDEGDITIGAQGVHLRRALERAGILQTVDALDVSPKGYSGAHYAVWPPELVRQLVDEMCPRKVCETCGEPSRRIVGEPTYTDGNGNPRPPHVWQSGIQHGRGAHNDKNGISGMTVHRETLGWSDCGHNTWRPGRVLDPFVGSGTTLAVTSGMARDAVGIDLDPRNALLATERVGMFLEVDDPQLGPVA